MTGRVEYRGEEVKILYVPARNKSKQCSICGYKTPESIQRRLWCPKCGTFLDRDENAAGNLAAGGLRFSPNGHPVEAMVEEREHGNATLILKVDGGNPSLDSWVDINIDHTKGLTEPVACYFFSGSGSAASSSSGSTSSRGCSA